MINRIILNIAIFCFIAGCNSVENAPVELKQAIENYCEFEKDKNWEGMYTYRRTQFQSTVPLDTYKRLMQRDAEEISFESYEIKDIRLKGDRAFVTMDVYLLLTPNKGSKFSEFVAMFSDKDEVRYREEDVNTEWIEIDGKWYLLDSNRMFQGLSRQIVHDS